MLHFICRVANNYGVIDTDDGVIEWVTKDELLEYAKQVDIVGVADMKPSPCTIESSKCNWSKGNNIFTNLKDFSCTNGRNFVICTIDNKKYKGDICNINGDCMLHFTCNVFVPISEFIYRLIKGGNSTHEQLVQKLRISGGQSLR